MFQFWYRVEFPFTVHLCVNIIDFILRWFKLVLYVHNELSNGLFVSLLVVPLLDSLIQLKLHTADTAMVLLQILPVFAQLEQLLAP